MTEGDKLFRTGRPIKARRRSTTWPPGKQSTTLEDEDDGIEEDAVMAKGLERALTVDIAAGASAGRRRQPVCGGAVQQSERDDQPRGSTSEAGGRAADVTRRAGRPGSRGGGGLTGCPLNPDPPKRSRRRGGATTRGVWSTGARARPERLGPVLVTTCRSPRPSAAVVAQFQGSPQEPPASGFERCRSRPYVAADLAAVLATYPRPRPRVAAALESRPVRPGAAATSVPPKWRRHGSASQCHDRHPAHRGAADPHRPRRRRQHGPGGKLGGGGGARR